MKKIFKRKIQGKLMISASEGSPESEKTLSLSLYEGENIIGRDPRQCDILLNLKDISSVHCKITINSIDDYTIEDMGSDTGVFKYNKNFVEDPYQKLRPGKEYELTENRIFYIASHKCVFTSKRNEGQQKKSKEANVDQNDISFISFKNWVENCRQSYREKSVAEGEGSEISELSESLEDLAQKRFKKKPGKRAKELMMLEDEEEEKQLRKQTQSRAEHFLSTENMKPYRKLFASKRQSLTREANEEGNMSSEENFLDIKRMDSFERKFVNRSVVLTSSREERMQLREKRLGPTQMSMAQAQEKKNSEEAARKSCEVQEPRNTKAAQEQARAGNASKGGWKKISEESLSSDSDRGRRKEVKRLTRKSADVQSTITPYLRKAKKKQPALTCENEALDELSETESEKEKRIKRKNFGQTEAAKIVVEASPAKKLSKNKAIRPTTPAKGVSDLDMSLSARLRRKRDEGGDTPDRDELLAYALQLLGDEVMAPILKNPALPKQRASGLRLAAKERAVASDNKKIQLDINSPKKSAGRSGNAEKMQVEKLGGSPQEKKARAASKQIKSISNDPRAIGRSAAPPAEKDERPIRIPDSNKKKGALQSEPKTRETRSKAKITKLESKASPPGAKDGEINAKRRAARVESALSASTIDLNNTINKILQENKEDSGDADLNSLKKKRKLNSGNDKQIATQPEARSLGEGGSKGFKTVRETKLVHSKILLKEKRKKRPIEIRDIEDSAQVDMLPKRNLFTVLFSCYKPDENTQKRLKSLGLVIVDSPRNNFNVLVVDQNFRRTVKLLIAICKGAMIVTRDWIDYLMNSQSVTDPAPFALRDPVAEKRFNFSLSRSLQASAKSGNKLLAGLKFWFPGHIRPHYRELEMLVTSAGGKVVINRPRAQENDVIVLLDKYDERNIQRFLSIGMTPYQVELVLAGCLRQKMEFAKYKLRL